MSPQIRLRLMLSSGAANSARTLRQKDNPTQYEASGLLNNAFKIRLSASHRVLVLPIVFAVQCSIQPQGEDSMSRTIRNQRLDSRDGRSKLPVRREPHWVRLGKGWHLGYRKIASDRGTWIARYRPENYGKRVYRSLGEADDIQDADDSKFLSFRQAQLAAERFFREAQAEGDDGVPRRGSELTVSDALADYFADREAHGHKSVSSDRARAAGLIEPVLGAFEVRKLKTQHLKGWLKELAESPARLRSAKGAEPAFREASDDPEEKRARRASANRTLAVLKAALNLAAKDDTRGLSDAAWRRVKPFQSAAAARVVFMSDDEIVRLINASQGAFRHLVTAALFTGARYGELCRLVVEDVDVDNGTLLIRTSKGDRGKRRGRRIYLTTEAVEFFNRLRMGKARSALLLAKDDGTPWKKSDQEKRFKVARQSAGIADDATFHSCRHVFAARLVSKGVPLMAVANQLGHSDIKMLEEHYGHLAPSIIADAVRGALGTLGVLEPTNVTVLKHSG
jgi:integrase